MRAGIAVPREPEPVGSFPTEERVSGTSPGNAMRIVSLLVVAMLLVACGDSSPVSPSPTLPQVAGTYTGQVDIELQGFGSGQVSGRMMVTQSGSQVTVALTLTFPDGDERGTPTTGTLTAASVLNIPLSAAPDVGEGDDDCGTLTPESIVTNFSGNSVRFEALLKVTGYRGDGSGGGARVWETVGWGARRSSTSTSDASSWRC